MSQPPEHILSERLLLPELKLLSIRYSSQALWISAEKRSDCEVCPSCASLCKSIYDHRWIAVKDEPVRDRQVFLKIHKRRFECKNCKKVFCEPVGGIMPRRRTTQRFRRAVLWACENFQSIKKVRSFYRISASTIYTALYEQLELRRRTRQNPWPKVIGIDEISFRRNKRFGCTEYVTVVVDIKNRKVIEMLLGKHKQALIEGLGHIPGRENVQCVVMDMCDPFRSFVKEFFPNANIVADKFHALRLPTPSLLTTLKNEVPVFSERRHMRLLLLRRPQKLEFFERSKLYAFLSKHPKLEAIYRAKEKLFSLYAIRNSPQSIKAYERLLEELKASPYEELQRLGKTLKRWRSEILAYFWWKKTNGIVEGFNNKLKLVKRMAYGYRSFRNFRLRSLNACAG